LLLLQKGQLNCSSSFGAACRTHMQGMLIELQL
jgi:hypothetical protein